VAIHQFMILDDPGARQVFDSALRDEIGEIRRIAAIGLKGSTACRSESAVRFGPATVAAPS
jgi:hypothetical protein